MDEEALREEVYALEEEGNAIVESIEKKRKRKRKRKEKD